MEKIQWKVEGITCSNCALTINNYLKNKGASNVSVNIIDGDVSFELDTSNKKDQLVKGIESLGYKVDNGTANLIETKRKFLTTNLQRFWFCLPFTIVLLLHMIPGIHIHFLMMPWIQLLLTVPVFITGMNYFGRSAINSIRNGLPNMNVLIAVGAFISFAYSLIGTIFNLGEDFVFYESTATIITLVFLGNYLEDASVQTTQRALKKLVKSQKMTAHMIAFDENHNELIFPIDSSQLKSGDLLLVKTGEQVPADCKILWGEALVNESLLTGESIPVRKNKKELLIGGSIIEDGQVKAQVTTNANESVLAQILNLVKKAQGERPPVQQLADKVSAIFVPIVLCISLLTLGINWIVTTDFITSLLRSIAVLVIACPCAMGLATPAAIAVGLGKAARNGILFRNARVIELFKDCRQV
ncbi:MAG: heavy metal translocating P-type ATPase, partial [Flavisolibacter sp.]